LERQARIRLQSELALTAQQPSAPGPHAGPTSEAATRVAAGVARAALGMAGAARGGASSSGGGAGTSAGGVAVDGGDDSEEEDRELLYEQYGRAAVDEAIAREAEDDGDDPVMFDEQDEPTDVYMPGYNLSHYYFGGTFLGDDLT
jgi:hypothetical protein